MLGTVEVPSSDAGTYEYGTAALVAGSSEPWKSNGARRRIHPTDRAPVIHRNEDGSNEFIRSWPSACA